MEKVRLSCEGSLVTHLWGKEERDVSRRKEREFTCELFDDDDEYRTMTDFYLHNIERTRRVRC